MTPARDDLLTAIPKAAAAAIHVRLPALRECVTMAGGFTLDELRKTTILSPSVRVSRLKANYVDTLDGPMHRYALDMAAYVITRNQPRLDRDDAALAIGQAILGLVPDRDWGIEEAGPAEKPALTCLVNGSVRDAAASLWVVRWRQPFVLACVPDPGAVTAEVYAGDNPFGESETYAPAEEAGR